MNSYFCLPPREHHLLPPFVYLPHSWVYCRNQICCLGREPFMTFPSLLWKLNTFAFWDRSAVQLFQIPPVIQAFPSLVVISLPEISVAAPRSLGMGLREWCPVLHVNSVLWLSSPGPQTPTATTAVPQHPQHYPPGMPRLPAVVLLVHPTLSIRSLDCCQQLHIISWINALLRNTAILGILSYRLNANAEHFESCHCVILASPWPCPTSLENRHLHMCTTCALSLDSVGFLLYTTIPNWDSWVLLVSLIFLEPVHKIFLMKKAHRNGLFSLASWLDDMLYPWSHLRPFAFASPFTHIGRNFHLQTEKQSPKIWLDLPNVQSRCENRSNFLNSLSSSSTLCLGAGHFNE